VEAWLMRLSLSVRVAEPPKRKDIADVPLEELAPMAKAAGFAALSMRASVVSVTSPPERVAAVKAVLATQGLAVSMITGDIGLAANNAAATHAIRDIGPHLALAEALDCPLVRIMTQQASDIADVQRAADKAAERNITLAHMTHWGTLIETVEDALDMVRQVGRPNFGLVYDPANTMACSTGFRLEDLRRLVPHLVNVKFQNARLDPDSPVAFNSIRRGRVGLRYVPVSDRSALDAAAMAGILRAEGYAGWLTVHQPLRDGDTVPNAIAEAAAFFRPLVV
jgi:sugar phosphate isomerase/epimerase